MQCCAECFSDRVLRKAIRDLSSATGKCPYCDSDNEPLLEPEALRYNFEILISAYRPDPGGKLLAPLLREEWGIFKHSRMDDFRAKDLLAAILDDHDIVRQTFVPAPYPGADWLGSWQKLRDELMYQNRFFPDVDIDLTFFEEILNGLVLEPYEVPDTWFRARIQHQDAPFLLNEMGAPPKRSASHGRANPAGIPYLYLGSKALTAISEIRPHTGENVCILDFKLPDGLKLIDLRNARDSFSPFTFDDADRIGKVRNALPFLERLGDDLTTPVLPQAAAIDYTPSQFLCEFIKRCGYDGVVYRSSVSDGINLALFDPALAVAGISVIPYRVTRVSVEASP
jgi:RES domain